MIEKLKVFNRIVKKSTLGRKRRWEEFRAFHKELLDSVPPELVASVSGIKNVCKNKSNYSMEMNFKDYAWWGTLSHKDCDMITVEELEEKVTEKLRVVLDSLGSSDISKEDAEEIIKLFNK